MFNFNYFFAETLQAINQQNTPKAEIYSQKAVKWGKRAKDLKSKIREAEFSDEDLANSLSYMQDMYEFSKKQNEKLREAKLK